MNLDHHRLAFGHTERSNDRARKKSEDIADLKGKGHGVITASLTVAWSTGANTTSEQGVRGEPSEPRPATPARRPSQGHLASMSRRSFMKL
jgi:hypothetical protein